MFDQLHTRLEPAVWGGEGGKVSVSTAQPTWATASSRVDVGGWLFVEHFSQSNPRTMCCRALSLLLPKPGTQLSAPQRK